jgi:hypothetical protein
MIGPYFRKMSQEPGIRNIIGFAEVNGEVAAVYECPISLIKVATDVMFRSGTLLGLSLDRHWNHKGIFIGFL